jgi:PAS domain S-box-containing protein
VIRGRKDHMNAVPLRVLLVEDDEDDYILVRKLLSEVSGSRYELDWVTAYDAALKAMQDGRQDVCVLDYRLGHHDGLELLQEARARGFWAPIIFLTGQGDYDVDLEAMRRGAADYLVKGQINAPLLERSIRYAIEQKKAQDALVRHQNELEERVKERTAELETANIALKREIAERKRAEQAIIRAKVEWERTFDATSDLIAVTDREYHIVRLNKAMAETIGIPFDEAVGLTCYQCFHGTKEPPSFCPHSQVLSEGKGHSFELHEDRLGGDFIVNVSPLRDPKGELMGSVHVARNITERKEAEREKEKLIAELRKALREVKTLSGMLPICSVCKKIRDDKGYWNQIEAYIRDRSEADFSHSICPECAKELYPDYYKE